MSAQLCALITHYHYIPVRCAGTVTCAAELPTLITSTHLLVSNYFIYILVNISYISVPAYDPQI